MKLTPFQRLVLMGLLVIYRYLQEHERRSIDGSFQAVEWRKQVEEAVK